ncbi:hypothetical protein KKC32_04435 [Patescibacteria group bacterium]|nr:hypothetical protein [Patescibacteria group bacterium]
MARKAESVQKKPFETAEAAREAPEQKKEKTPAELREEIMKEAQATLAHFDSVLGKLEDTGAEKEAQPLRKTAEQKRAELEARLTALEEGAAKPAKRVKKEEMPTREATKLIREATDIDSLIDSVRKIGSFRDSHGRRNIATYKLIERLEAIRDEGATPDSPAVRTITDDLGLRDKVMDILKEPPVHVGEEDISLPEMTEIPKTPPKKPEAPTKIVPETPEIPTEKTKAPPEKPEAPPELPEAPPSTPEAPPTEPPTPESGAETAAEPNLDELRASFAKKDAALTNKYSGITGWMRRVVDRGGYKQSQMERNDAYKEYSAERAVEVAENVKLMLAEQALLADDRAEAFAKEKGWGNKFYKWWKKTGVLRLGVAVGLVGGGFLLAGPIGALPGVLAYRKIIGGVGAGVGSYDLMKKGADALAPKIKLSAESQKEMDSFVAENNITWMKRRSNKEGARDKYNEKLLELEAREAPQMDNADLDKMITYFESVPVLQGYKPSENPTYRLLMKEKYKRMKEALKADETEAPPDSPKRELLNDAIEDRKNEKIQEKVAAAIGYLKLKYLMDNKLSPQKGDDPTTENYKRWAKVSGELQDKFDKLPPDVQTFIEKNSGVTAYGPGMEMLDRKIIEAWKGKKPEEIDESKLAESDWELDTKVQVELVSVLDDNEIITKEAEEEARAEMKEKIKMLEQQEGTIENKKAALAAFFKENMAATDKAIEERTKKAIYADAAMKATAIGIGLLVGSGIIQEYLHGKFAEAAPAKAPIEGPGGAGEIEPEAVEAIAPMGKLGTELTSGEGFLHGMSRLINQNPEMFKGMSAQQIHDWKVNMLKELKFKFTPEEWGYVKTPHPGLHLELVPGKGPGGLPELSIGKEHISEHAMKFMRVVPDVEVPSPAVLEAPAAAAPESLGLGSSEEMETLVAQGEERLTADVDYVKFAWQTDLPEPDQIFPAEPDKLEYGF